MNELSSVVLFFIIGLILGSFYSCVGMRLVKKEPYINARSKCPYCHHILNWYELIPIISFLLQNGKCLHCHKKVSYIYPLIEFITGSLFVYSFMHLGWKPELIRALLLISMLMLVFVSDILYMIIPNRVLLFFLPLFVVLSYLLDKHDTWWAVFIPVILIVCIVGCIILLSKGGMGLGDLKLFAVLGFVVGWKEILLILFIACFLGAIFGYMLLIFRRIHSKEPIPFGPYIVVATLLTYYFSVPMINWYSSLF